MSNVYAPDKWMLVKMTNFARPQDTHYRVFAVWYGGFTKGDSWKLNSGITRINYSEESSTFEFIGSSGSVYKCSKYSYGTSGYGMSVLNQLINNANSETLLMEPIYNFEGDLNDIPELLAPYLDN